MKHALRYTSAAVLLGISGSAVAAVDLDEFDNADLVDHWRATAILGGDAVGDNGNRIGSVHEMVLGDDGLVQDVVITRSPNGNLDQQYLTVPWSKTTFEPASGDVQLSFTADAASERPWKELPPVTGPSQWKVSRMIGMDVDSVDDVPEGQVEDILITDGTNDMSAYVIEAPISNETYYALPGDPSFVDYEEGELDLPYTASAIEELPELDY